MKDRVGFLQSAALTTVCMLPAAVGLHHDLYSTTIVIMRWLNCHLLLVANISTEHEICQGKPAINMAMHHLLMLRWVFKQVH